MKKEVITEDVLRVAIEILEGRIRTPAPAKQKCYSRKEAFLKLCVKAREALSAGHSLETILDDLKGVGLGMTLSTARQYLKPGRKSAKPRNAKQTEALPKQLFRPSPETTAPKQNVRKGTFNVIDDEKEI